MRTLFFFALALLGITWARAALPNLEPSLSGTPSFSFKYGGKDSADFISDWNASSSAGHLGNSYRVTYVDPATRLEVTVEVITLPQFGAVEWTLRFRNNGAADTPVIEEVKALDWTVPVNGPAIVHHPHGSKAEPQDFMPQDEALQAGKPLSFSSSNGRSSQGNMPFFNLAWKDGGICGAIGWTGDWLATFTPSDDGASVRVQAGMWQTHLVLHPGEEIRTPRIVIMPWKGKDWMVAQNEWRKLMLARYTVHVNGKPVVGPVSYGTWGADTAAHKLAQIALVKDQKLPIDNFWIDAAWYDKCVGHGISANPNGPEPFWRGRGSWVINPANYPDGLGPISAAAHAAGMSFLLWLEPEEADPDTILRKEDPDWFYSPPLANNPGTAILNLGDPLARAGITALVAKIIQDNGVDWYRQDFNVDPHRAWAAADTPDRVGMTEIRHIEGLYAFWDELRTHFPKLLIDNCASGGQRLDIETLSRSTPLWRSDLAGPPNGDIVNQTQTQGLAPWVPVNGCCPWTAPGPFDESQVPPDPYNAKLIYTLRSGYSAAMVLGLGQAQGKDPAWCAKLRQQLLEYKEVQPYIYGDFYPLMPWSTAPDTQVAWQWDLPDKKSGVVVVLRRAGCPNGDVSLNLHALDPDAMYVVEIRTGLEHGKPQPMKGGDLAALKVKITDQPGSALVFYRPILKAAGN